MSAVKSCERCGGAILTGVTGWGGPICTCGFSERMNRPMPLNITEEGEEITCLRAENAAQALLIVSLKEERDMWLRKSESHMAMLKDMGEQYTIDGLKIRDLTQQLSDTQRQNAELMEDNEQAYISLSIEGVRPNSLREGIAELMQRVGEAECTWTEADSESMPGTYEGTCGIMWSFTEGGLNENECLFCPRCGGRIAASKVSNEVASKGDEIPKP
jgi:hypothetical protein